MKRLHEEIQRQIQLPKGLHCVLLHTNDIQRPLTCLAHLFSGEKKFFFQEGNNYSIYEIDALLRVLNNKTGITNTHVQSALFNQKKSELCRILTWENVDRKVVLIGWHDFAPVLPQVVQEFLENDEPLFQTFSTLLSRISK